MGIYATNIPYLQLHPGHGRAMAERGSVYTGRALPSPNWSTSRRPSRRGSRRGSSVNTHPRRASFFLFICATCNKGKIWRRPGQAKCKWDISPTMHDLPSQCKSEGSPGHGQTGEDNFGEGLVRLSVNRVYAAI